MNEIEFSHLVSDEELRPIVEEFRGENPYADGTALAEYLVRRGLLSTYQATRLLEGTGRGLVLGPYVIIDAVGSGSMGTVYKALGKADRKAYALKVLPARGPWNVRLARRRLASFPTEPHPAVVPFLDVGTSAGQHYLVWPFVAGETLEQLVRREGLLPPAQAALVGLHIGQALQYCERHRVYHGLIKPSNVLIDPNGQTKLLDFGVGPILADAESSESLVDTLSESNTALNMLDCLSPEAVVDPTRRSIRGDQYSLGCTLYFALTGRYPFPDGTAIEKMSAHQSAQPTPVMSLNPGVPSPLARIIERLMQKSPELRYNNFDELIEPLHGLARQSTVYQPPMLTPPPKSVSRGPTTTPHRSSPTLLSAVTPKPPSPSLSSLDMTPPPPARPSRPSAAASSAGRDSPKPAANSPRVSVLERLARILLFWMPKRDAIGCTILAPASVMPGESVAVQAVIHQANRSAQARSLPGYLGSETLTQLVARGSTLDLDLRVYDFPFDKPKQPVKWAGFSAATIFSIRIPDDWSPGRLVQGMLTIRAAQERIGQIEFCLAVGVANSAVPT